MAAPLIRGGALATFVALVSSAAAQAPQTATSNDRLTTEQRIAALESELASLEARLQGRGSIAPGPLANSSDLALTSRLEQLERSLDRVTADLQRVERLADNAMREASEARREAERAARDAARLR